MKRILTILATAFIANAAFAQTTVCDGKTCVTLPDDPTPPTISEPTVGCGTMCGGPVPSPPPTLVTECTAKSCVTIPETIIIKEPTASPAPVLNQSIDPVLSIRQIEGDVRDGRYTTGIYHIAPAAGGNIDIAGTFCKTVNAGELCDDADIIK